MEEGQNPFGHEEEIRGSNTLEEISTQNGPPVRIINSQLPTLHINNSFLSYLPSFLYSTLCKLSSTCHKKSNLLKLSHGALGKPPRNHIQHVCFIPDPPKHISAFSAKLPVLLRNKEKGKVRLGVVDLFFSLIILHPFSPNKSMYELSFHPLLSFLLDFSNS